MIQFSAADALFHIHRNSNQDFFIQARTYGEGVGLCRSWKLKDLRNENSIDAFITENSERHVGVNIALRRTAAAECMGNVDAEVLDVLFVDLDVKPGGVSSKDDAIRFLTEELTFRPSLVVDSGNGIHGYFTLSEPLEIFTYSDREQAIELFRAFGAYVAREASEKYGWKIDTVSDLARIAAVPLSLNHKTSPPSLRVPVWSAEAVVDLQVLQALLAQLKVGDDPKRSSQSSGKEPSKWQKALSDIEMAWLRAKEEEKLAVQRGFSVDPVKANAAAIAEGCGFFRRFFQEQEALPHNDWFYGLSIAKACYKGDDVAKVGSEGHPNFSEQETSAKLNSSSGPATCSAIRALGGCDNCVFRDRLSSGPIELGSRTADEVKRLKRYAYVEKTDEVFDLERNEGSSTLQFRRFHAAERGRGKHTDEVFLADPLAMKAHTRTYDPERSESVLVKKSDGTLLLNTYRRPEHGAGGIGDARVFFDHLNFLVPDQGEREVLVYWLAHLVQKPWVKLRYSIVLVGGQGTGKSALISILKRVLGDRNVNVAKGSALLGRFNGHLSGGVLLFLEEVSVQGRMEAYEDVKTLITEENSTFERKGKDQEILPTPRGVLLLSNDQYALHLPSDDRRFFVIQSVERAHEGGAEYYERLFSFSDDDAAALYNDLSKLNLSAFSPHQLPFETRAKKVMVENSRPEVEVIIQEMIESRSGVFHGDLVTIADVAQAARERTGDRSLSERRVRKALLTCGAVNIDMQVSLRSGRRVRFWSVRNHEDYASKTPIELARSYDSAESLSTRWI